ncbi:8658_t:CDS:2, partial [Cetraspora pellucida]
LGGSVLYAVGGMHLQSDGSTWMLALMEVGAMSVNNCKSDEEESNDAENNLHCRMNFSLKKKDKCSLYSFLNYLHFCTK